MSSPEYVFDAQLTYDLAPLLFEQITENGGGGTATVAHDTTDRCATMSFSSALTGAYSRMQTYEHFRYQPGRSQMVFATFNFLAHTANVTKYVGYSDGSNGVELRSNGTGFELVLLSDSTLGDQTVAQASWNLDKLNGTGTSGITLAVANTNILVIDMQALYVGRVRVGFDIDGSVIYVHEFLHANRVADPYIQTANLPVRAGMTAAGTVTASMQFICCSVISEGGNRYILGYQFSVNNTATAASGARTHMISLQPSLTFNSIANRSKFFFESLELVVTGINPILWELCIGDVITGTTTFNAVNATYSATEYNFLGTTSESPSIVIASGLVAASASQKSDTQFTQVLRYPITLDAAGAARALGRLTMLVTGIGGASACRGVMNWREIR